MEPGQDSVQVLQAQEPELAQEPGLREQVLVLALVQEPEQV